MRCFERGHEICIIACMQGVAAPEPPQRRGVASRALSGGLIWQLLLLLGTFALLLSVPAIPAALPRLHHLASPLYTSKVCCTACAIPNGRLHAILSLCRMPLVWTYRWRRCLLLFHIGMHACTLMRLIGVVCAWPAAGRRTQLSRHLPPAGVRQAARSLVEPGVARAWQQGGQGATGWRQRLPDQHLPR